MSQLKSKRTKIMDWRNKADQNCNLALEKSDVVCNLEKKKNSRVRM